MGLQYIGLKEINGPLIVIDKAKDVSFDEIAFAFILFSDESNFTLPAASTTKPPLNNCDKSFKECSAKCYQGAIF